MCDIEVQKKILQALKDLHVLQKMRSDIDETVQISKDRPYIVNYKDRYKIYAFSANGLTVSLEDIGQFTILPNVWADISFVPGMRIFAPNQSTPSPMLVRCTDNQYLSQSSAASSSPIPVATIATITNVSAATSSTPLLGGNSSRKGATIYNDSTAILYLNLSSTAASTSNYSVQIPAQAYYELLSSPIYIGAITGIWSAANGFARVTELT